MLWTGRILSGLAVAAFIAGGIGKLVGGPHIEQQFEHLNLPLDMRVPLAVLEIACAVIYAIPATSLLGAILLAGYMGGTICAHWSVGDNMIVQITIGVVVWIGIFLREPRLWSILPIRW